MKRAWVDGSYNLEQEKSSWAVIIVDENDSVIDKRNGIIDDLEVCKMRNVAGECKAAMVAASIGVDEIYYDYSGIEQWAKGAWKAKNPYTKAYANYMKNYTGKFIKVVGHSGDKYNNMVDRLAAEVWV